MLTLTKGQTSESIYVTLNEKRTLTAGYYLFYFEHITTRETATKIYAFAEDESSYSTRFNKFTINTQSIFGSKSVGEWVYQVYEQASGVNTNPTGLTMVESGILVLNPATEFTYDKYNVATTYKAYNG
jgi:hypothetical protein